MYLCPSFIKKLIMDVPFIYGRLAERESFIDRVEDRKELKNFLRHGINVILVSPRRWGKSGSSVKCVDACRVERIALM